MAKKEEWRVPCVLHGDQPVSGQPSHNYGKNVWRRDWDCAECWRITYEHYSLGYVFPPTMPDGSPMVEPTAYKVGRKKGEPRQTLNLRRKDRRKREAKARAVPSSPDWYRSVSVALPLDMLAGDPFDDEAV
jgi:hypothetical protein